MFTNKGPAPIAESFLSAIPHFQAQLVFIEDEDIRANGQKTLIRVKEILERMQAAENKIAVDRHLSSTGREAALVQLAKSMLADLKFLKEKADDLDGAYTSLRTKLYAVPDSPMKDPLIAYLREQEIRAELRRMSQPGLMTAYLQAVADDNADIVRAIKLKPGQPFLDSGFVERVDREHLETKQPEQIRRLDALEHLRTQVRTLWEQLDRKLSGYGVELKPYAIPPKGRNDITEPDRWRSGQGPLKSPADAPGVATGT